MAVARTVIGAVREEAAALVSDVALASRGQAAEVVRLAEVEAAGMRQAARSGKIALSSDVTAATTHMPRLPPSLSVNTSTTLESIPNLLPESRQMITKESRTMVTSVIEEDLGVTLREVMSNATQTGAEEQADQLGEVAKQLIERPDMLQGMQMQAVA